MKKTISIVIMLMFITGCATTFKEQRDASRPMIKLAMLKFQKDDIPGALFELKKAREKNPKDPEIYYGLALIYRDLGKPKEALECCKKAIAYGNRLALEHPGMASEARNLEGVILFKQGNNKDAISAFKHALKDELYPTPEYALKNLAEVYISLREFDKAKESLKMALDHNSHYAPAWEALSRLFVLQGEYEPAINALRHATLEFPGYAEAHWGLAELYLKTGRRSDSIRHLREVVRLDRDGPLRKLALQRLMDLGVSPE
ncbi:MAG: tetratricopeptide repeat protein [Thermodesulfobacteriota bacterium]|nr:tetratricopeptide repeat protein [Thermodesulfobacteriota bacterium]